MLTTKLFDLPIPTSDLSYRYLVASITRPGDTTAYTANDAFADSTSAPLAGGFPFTVSLGDRQPSVSASAQGAGGTLIPFPAGGRMNDMIVVASAATAYQGEIWMFERGVTAINDNAAFAISDTEALALVGVLPFNTTATATNNAISYVQDFDGIGFACDPQNIRFLVKILNAPTPGNAEVLSFRIKYQPLRGF